MTPLRDRLQIGQRAALELQVPEAVNDSIIATIRSAPPIKCFMGSRSMVAYLKALGGRPGGAALEYSCRPGSRGVMGRRVDTRRAPGGRTVEGEYWTNNN